VWRARAKPVTHVLATKVSSRFCRNVDVGLCSKDRRVRDEMLALRFKSRDESTTALCVRSCRQLALRGMKSMVVV
jgi:hypothetical protein